MFKSLSGIRTYLVALGIGTLTVLHALGWIDDELFKILCGLLGSGGLATLRAGIKNNKSLF